MLFVNKFFETIFKKKLVQKKRNLAYSTFLVEGFLDIGKSCDRTGEKIKNFLVGNTFNAGRIFMKAFGAHNAFGAPPNAIDLFSHVEEMGCQIGNIDPFFKDKRIYVFRQGIDCFHPFQDVVAGHISASSDSIKSIRTFR